METIKHLLLYILFFTPFMFLMAFGFFIIWQDRKREKLEEENLKKAKQC